MKYLILLLVLFCSCSKDIEPNKVYINRYLSTSLINSAGQDLFLSNDYNVNNIKISFLKQGVEQEVENEVNLNYITQMSPSYLRIPLNFDQYEDLPITYIKWNSVDTDTVIVSYKKVEGSNNFYEDFDKVWYNGRLLPSTEYGGGKTITILK